MVVVEKRVFGVELDNRVKEEAVAMDGRKADGLIDVRRCEMILGAFALLKAVDRFVLLKAVHTSIL